MNHLTFPESIKKSSVAIHNTFETLLFFSVFNVALLRDYVIYSYLV